MDRNTLTTAGELKHGDRFYKAADKHKTVHQIVSRKPKTTGFRTYKIFSCTVDVIDGSMHESAKSGYYRPITKDLKVVYLRNQYETQ